MEATLDYESRLLSQEEVECMFGCRAEELCPDMLVIDLETLVIPHWENELD